MLENYIFFLLRIFTILICVFLGVLYSKQPKKKYLLYIIILVLSLNEGLRFGRGTDYNGYFFKYHDILKYGFSEPKEFLFIVLCKLNNVLYLPYQGLIFFISMILFISGSIFLKNHREIFPYGIALFYIFTLDAENLIRWFLGFSLLLVSLYYADRLQYLKALLFCFVSVLFHAGLVLVIPIFIFFRLIKKRLFSPIISTLLYLFFFLIFKVELIATLSDYLMLLSLGDQFGGYTHNAEAWLSTSFVSQKINMGVAINDIIIIFLGSFVIKKNPKLTYYYNLYLLGVILSPALYQIEILYRIDLLFKLFQFLFIGYSIKYFLIDEFKTKGLVVCALLINISRVYIFNILSNEDPNAYLYIWDAMGRNVLPI